MVKKKKSRLPIYIILAAIAIAIGGLAWWYSARDETGYTPYDNSIVVGGVEFPFNYPIEEFMGIETQPLNQHVQAAMLPDREYYIIEWNEECEEDQTCGVISIGALNIARAVNFVYQHIYGTEAISVAGNSSVTFYLEPETILEGNLSDHRGTRIVLSPITNESRNQITVYNTDSDLATIVIEGDSQENFLKAVDKFTYLILSTLK